MWIKVANIVLTFKLKPKLPLFLVLITYLRLTVSTEALDIVTDFPSGESGLRDRVQICVGEMLSWLVSKVCGTKVCRLILCLVALIFKHMAIWWRACPQNPKVLIGTQMLRHGDTGQPELIPAIPAGPSQTCFSSWESSSIFDGSHVKLHRTAHTGQEVPARITDRVCQFSE